MSENPLPFKLNLFKQVERFQSIALLDRQFEKMLAGWKTGDFKKHGTSKKLNNNYPTWEIEKKILLWSAVHHKHLGSPLKTSHLGDGEFRKDIHISETEINFAGPEEVLKNLVARGLAVWEEGAKISEEGIAWGLLISNLYDIVLEKNIQKGETKFREETLTARWPAFWGYKILFYNSLLIILLALLILSLTLDLKARLIFLSFPAWFTALLTFFIFLPVILYITSLFLIRLNGA